MTRLLSIWLRLNWNKLTMRTILAVLHKIHDFFSLWMQFTISSYIFFDMNSQRNCPKNDFLLNLFNRYAWHHFYFLITCRRLDVYDVFEIQKIWKTKLCEHRTSNPKFSIRTNVTSPCTNIQNQNKTKLKICAMWMIGFIFTVHRIVKHASTVPRFRLKIDCNVYAQINVRWEFNHVEHSRCTYDCAYWHFNASACGQSLLFPRIGDNKQLEQIVFVLFYF